MARRFTESKDGIMRADIRITVRLDRKQIALLESFSKLKKTTLLDVLETEASFAIDGLLSRVEEGEDR